ncbi:MAG: hypothetical protein RLZZ293_825 [Pseudomonadota bacterium]|jgi:2-polyprenyl-6-hydroxyphenyl methylase/3-demethylubiquinone-9 3-methyltransferase
MYSQVEIDKFNNLAHHWWDKQGEFKTLHQINPTRLAFIQQYANNLNEKQIIDVGCGGGILTESLAACGGHVCGIDLAPQSIEIAKLHLQESNLTVDYQCIEVGEKAKLSSQQFDILTCMEMLEHVPDPRYIIEQCSKLLKPNGLAFFSTLNRNFKSYALGVVAAEYILNLVPRGTHNYQQFITPAELRQLLVANQLEIIALKGMSYNPFTAEAKLNNDSSINYLVACRKLD